MKQDILVLDEDKAWAKSRIAELEQAILDLGPEFNKVFAQSSETWHDNAPFDALRDRQSVLDAELQQLKLILRTSLPSIPKQKKGEVAIGSTVTVEYDSGRAKTYKIAGDWTPVAGVEHDGATTISVNSPLAKQLLGKKLSEVYSFRGKLATVVTLA